MSLMSSASASPLPPPLPALKVGQPTFVGILWAGTGLSLCFLAFRLLVKLRSFKKLDSEDYVCTLAWTVLFASSVLWAYEAPIMYENNQVETQKRLPGLDFQEKHTTFLHNVVAFNVFFYSCLWSVKLSLLLFFRRLRSKQRSHQVWWWCVLGVCVVTWAACVADIQWQCTVTSFEHVMSYCMTPAAVQFQWRTFYANCAVDVITDCLVLSIPVIILWPVKIAPRKKAILLAIFSLTIFTMVIAIIRVTIVNQRDRNADLSWLYLWSNVEMATSVIICCTASFRQLFVTAHGQNQSGKPKNHSAWRALLSSFKWKGFSSSSSGFQKYWPISRRSPTVTTERDANGNFVPLNSIHVDHYIDIRSGDFNESKLGRATVSYPNPRPWSQDMGRF